MNLRERLKGLPPLLYKGLFGRRSLSVPLNLLIITISISHRTIGTGVKTARFVLVTSSIFSLSSICAAHPHDFQQWTILNAHVSLEKAKRWQLYLETQPRQGNDWKRSLTAQNRVAFVYNPSAAVGLYAGYAWTPSFVDPLYHRDYRDEQRFWQQVLYRHNLLGVSWQHRVRQEQRMIMRTNGVAHRSRYMVKGSYPLSDSGDFGIAAYDEIMVNLNSLQGGVWSGYDRNRIFFGPYWRVGGTRYEMGYVGEHLKRFGDDERWAHVLSLTIAFEL